MENEKKTDTVDNEQNQSTQDQSSEQQNDPKDETKDKGPKKAKGIEIVWLINVKHDKPYTAGERVTLPKDEAEEVIAAGYARKVGE